MNSKTKDQLNNINAEQALHHLSKLKKSARWKLGNLLIGIVEKLLFRKKTKLSIEFLEDHLKTIQSIALRDVESKHTKNKIIKFNKVTFLVSDPNIKTSIYGDTHVANDLGIALSKKLEHCQYQLATEISGTEDSIISMLWNSEITTKLENQTAFAWVRNYPERWIENASFHLYDFILCSSKKIKTFIESKSDTPCYLFPIAANTDRFKSRKSTTPEGQICFIGNKWEETRPIETLAQNQILNIKVYGKGWDKLNNVNARGTISNLEIPNIYNQSAFVIDSANETTKKWESLNSRIYNAIATKSLPITDSQAASELFKNKIPLYNSAEELHDLINLYKSNPNDYSQTINSLHTELVSRHSFHIRAETLLLLSKQNLNIAIKIAPKIDQKLSFGDYHFARELGKSLEAYGHTVRIDCCEDWYNEKAVYDDLAIVLRGLKVYEPLMEQTTFMWMISHPNEVTNAEIENYNHIFCASGSYTKYLSGQFKGTSISKLLQCTSPDTFQYLPSKRKECLLFVGNSRNVNRKCIQYAIQLNLELHVYGNGWEKFIDEKYIKGNYVPNEELYLLYNQYDIVLNDHWDDMKKYGFLSNRLYDATACKANILSDAPEGIATEFKNVFLFFDLASFKDQVLKIRANKSFPDDDFQVVINKHTFKDRAQNILNKYYKISDVQ